MRVSGLPHSFSPLGRWQVRWPRARRPRGQCRPAAGAGPGHVHARRPDRAGAHRLQLGPRARARRPQRPAAARHVRPAVHGHRRDGQPGDRALPLADRAVALDVLEQNYEYDLLEPDKLLRKYVGRDVTLVRLVQDGGDHAAGGSEGAAPQLQQRARSGRSATRSSPACTPITSASPSCRAISTRGRR